MGLVKSEWIEAQERGWSAPDTFVCPDCVDDDFLKDLIEAAACADTCDYCGRQSEVDLAAPAEVVVEAVFDAVHTYYCEPTSGGLPYDGGFLIEPIGISEVLDNLGFTGNMDFVQAVADAEANGDSFVHAADGHWAGIHPHQAMSAAWTTFTEAVKHETRFNFAKNSGEESYSPYEIGVAETLPAVAHQLRSQLRSVDVGTKLFRTRIRRRGEKWLPTEASMGPPPKEVASAGRMNPAGIPYLYMAFDKETAKSEVGAKRRTSHAVFTAVYEVTAPLLVVDLTQTPVIPSIFDVENKDAREHALFVCEFIRAIAIPVAKDGREHIDYVPTQVICEYLAQVFEPRPGLKLSGLIYPSAAKVGGKNLVIFPEDRFSGRHPAVAFKSAGK